MFLPMADTGAVEARGRLQGRRILVVTQHPYPAHRIVRRNIELLASEGAEVDVVCTGSGELVSPPRGIRLIRVPLAHQRRQLIRYVFEYVAFLVAATAIVGCLCLRRRYDVAQVDTLPDFLILAALPARLRGARIVLFMLELMPELVATRLAADRRHPLVRLARLLEGITTRSADAIITVSEPCRRVLEARGVPARKLTVVTGSVPLDAIGAAEPAIRVAPPYAVVVATLIRRYGVDIAIRALSCLDGASTQLRLVVLGDGEARGELEALCARLGLNDRVLFVGQRPWNEAMAYVRDASIGLVPIRADGYGELLLPTKLFEYAALGVPAVCARLPTLVEHFPPGSVAYFEPEDPEGLAREIDRLVRDPGAGRIQAMRMAEAARELSWERARVHYLDAIAALLDADDASAKAQSAEAKTTVAAR